MQADDPHKQINLENIQTLDKTSRVTAIDLANDSREILIGRVKPVVKVYGIDTDQYVQEVEVSDGPVVGLCKYNGTLIVGLANGKIQIDTKKPEFIVAGDAMSRMRQCHIDGKLVATGGKERQNNLKVWNLENNECVFKTKNISNDFLQLEVPIWDSDFGFIDANCLTTCSRYGYVRVYDMRARRRPMHNFTNDKEQISYPCLATRGNVVWAGTTTGIMHAFDLRKMKLVLHTYKGFTGSISDVVVDDSGQYVCTASLDRFVRVHDVNTTGLLYQCYVKSKATRVLLRNGVEAEAPEGLESSEDDEIAEEKIDGNVAEFDEIFDNMQTIE